MTTRRNSYTKLEEKNICVKELLNWHFNKILTDIHRRISSRERIRNPWTIEIKSIINWSLFYKFFVALDTFETAFGREINIDKNKQGRIKNICIIFNHYLSFVRHFGLICDKEKPFIQSKLKKKLPSGCVGKVVVTNEKPLVMSYNKRTETLTLTVKYEVYNRYGILC